MGRCFASAGWPIQASACPVTKLVAWSCVSKTGRKRRTRSCVMLPVPLRIETAAAKRPPSRRRVKGVTRYFPTLKVLRMNNPSVAQPRCDGAGLTENGAPEGTPADELCPAADPQGYSLRARGNQNKGTAEAIRTSGEGWRSPGDLGAWPCWRQARRGAKGSHYSACIDSPLPWIIVPEPHGRQP